MASEKANFIFCMKINKNFTNCFDYELDFVIGMKVFFALALRLTSEFIEITEGD